MAKYNITIFRNFFSIDDIPKDADVKDSIELQGKEKEAIKIRYLGAERKKKRIRRQNDRKFIFDWEAGDDTSTDYNPIYSDRNTPIILYIKLHFIRPFIHLPVCRSATV